MRRLDTLYEDLAYSLSDGKGNDFAALMRMGTVQFHEFLEAARRGIKNNS